MIFGTFVELTLTVVLQCTRLQRDRRPSSFKSHVDHNNIHFFPVHQEAALPFMVLEALVTRLA